MDATHLGRDPDGGDVQAELLREVASGLTLAASVALAAIAAHGADVTHVLDKIVAVRGGTPLVLLADNGPSYKSEVVEAWCALHGVVHLFTLTRTPQHNARSERGMPHGSTVVTREAVLADAACRIRRAVLNSERGRARRRAVRLAILDALETHSVLHRT